MARVSVGVAILACVPQPAGPASTARRSSRQNPPAPASDRVKNVLSGRSRPFFFEPIITEAPSVESASTPALTVLGSFALRVEGAQVRGLPRKAQALLTFVALQRGRRVSRDVVADLLWTHSGPNQARQSLRQSLLVLRRTLTGNLLQADADAVWIEAGKIHVDALAMEAALTDGETESLSEAALLYRGPLLGEFSPVAPRFDDWLQTERPRFAHIAAELLRRIAAVQIDSCDFNAAAATAADLIRLDSLDEAAQRLRMDCLARSGRRAEALQQYESCVRLLQTELGVPPDADTVAVAERIRSGISVRPPANQSSKGTGPPAGTGPPDSGPASPPESAAANGAVAAPVERDGAAPPGPRMRHARRALAWSLGMLCAAALAVAGIMVWPIAAPPRGLALAGLQNVSGIPSQSDALNGFVDLVRYGLATQHHVRLIDHASGADASADATDLLVVRNNGGRYLLDGTAGFENNTLHVAARLIDVRNGAELWSNHFDVPAADASRTAEAIASQAARAIASDSDVAANESAAPFTDPEHAARQLVALGHLIDYTTSPKTPATQAIYRMALHLDPGNTEILVHLANTYIRQAVAVWPLDTAALAAADNTLSRAQQLASDNVDVLFNLCLLRRLQGRIQEATELCRRTLDINPRYPGALRELGNDALEQGDASAAVTWYQASIDAAPPLPYNFLVDIGIGAASLVQGRMEEAKAWFAEAIAADTWDAGSARLWLAAVLEMQGQHDEAARTLAAFMRANPNLKIDPGYLMLLSAPAYADWRNRVMAALANASRP
jgi:DNA-binding SARP family transcriptional activator/TolB-like protein/Tfp pilus assembly protein PilF